MTSSLNLGIVSNHMELLHGHAYFRPEDGPLKECLSGLVLDGLDGSAAENLSGQNFDLEVSVGRQEGYDEVVVGIRVDHLGAIHTAETPLAALPETALEELAGYLSRLVESAAPAEPAVPGAVVVRKKVDSEDSHEKSTASARLKVTPQWLKSVIPCTDYTYDEIDGKKYIREYYWSKELIERLFKIKCTKTTPEDLQYVAQECCEGDLEWARDLIARLKSPNRAETVPKEQAAKSQNQGQRTQNQGKAPAKAAPNERLRSRSRNRKPGREAGKEQGGKPDSNAPKTPAS